MNWAYAVTTVPERNEFLHDTLESMEKAGFSNPLVCMDGVKQGPLWLTAQYPDVATHWPRIGAFGNWILAAWELRVRYPKADRYVIFQDDIQLRKNLREYLERCMYPSQGYWNLYLADCNVSVGQVAWYPAPKMGVGALGLAFDAEAFKTLLSQRVLVDHSQHDKYGKRRIDGIVYDSMKNAGFREYVHHPSLLQHLGAASSIGSNVESATASTYIQELTK